MELREEDIEILDFIANTLSLKDYVEYRDFLEAGFIDSNIQTGKA